MLLLLLLLFFFFSLPICRAAMNLLKILLFSREMINLFVNGVLVSCYEMKFSVFSFFLFRMVLYVCYVCMLQRYLYFILLRLCNSESSDLQGLIEPTSNVLQQSLDNLESIAK